MVQMPTIGWNRSFPKILARIKEKGCKRSCYCHHVDDNTMQPVKVY